MATDSEPSARPPHTHFETINIWGNAQVHNGPKISQSSAKPDAERAAVLNWLSPLRSAEIHNKIRQQVPNFRADRPNPSGDWTGKWLIESDVFRDWKERKTPRLWYRGMRKLSVIVDHLQALVNTFEPRRKVSSLYLQYKTDHPINHLVGSVVRQLVEDETHLPEVVLETYKRRTRNGETNATVTVLSSLLCDIASQFPVYIVLDALDEYYGVANCENDSISKRLLNHLVPDAAEEGSISIVITSRLLDDFKGLSEPFHQVKIVAHDRDLAIFVDHEFSNNSRFQRYSRRDPRFRNLVEKTVTRTCGGMFLLARLHMEALRNQLTEADLYEKLRTLPNGIDSTYDMIMERLLGLPTKEKRFLVWNSLAWIVLSRRRLQTAELQHALACTKGAQNLDPRGFYDLEDVEELCGGLIEYTNSTVVLVHYTAQSYFDTRANYLFAGFHDIIAQACFRYIGFFSLGVVPGQKAAVTVATTDSVTRSQYWLAEQDADFIPSQILLYDVLRIFPFLEYAMLHSKYHLNWRDTNPAPKTPNMLKELLNDRKRGDTDPALETLNMLKGLLHDRKKRDLLFFLLQQLRLYPVWTIKPPPHRTQRPKRSLVSTQSDSVAITSNARGNEPILIGTREEQVSGRETEQVGSSIRLQRFIPSLDVEAWLEPRMKGFVLNIEPEKQHEYLLIKVIIWSIMAKIDERNRTPSQSPSELARDTTKVISHTGGARSQAAPRAWYIRGDDDQTYPVTLKHESGIPKEEDRSICSPLHLVVCLGWTRLVDYTAQSFGNINAVDSSGNTPLWVATLTENFEAAEILLSRRDAFVDLFTMQSHFVLINLAQNQRSHLIGKLLSRAHLSLLVQPFRLLFDMFCFVIAKILLRLLGVVGIQRRAWKIKFVRDSLRIRSYDLQLLDAAHQGDLPAIKNLIGKGRVDTSSTGRSIITAVFLATALHWVDVVEYLLHYGIDIDSSGPHGTTLLHLATSLGDVAMVKMLLARGADASAKDDNGRPAWMASLHVANRKELMGMFIEAGIRLDTFEPDGGTWTLYTTACTGNIELVRLILESGGNPSQQTPFGWTPLHFAADRGNLDCVLALLEANAEISPLSDTSMTPLDMAIQGKQAYIAKLLRHAGAKTSEELYAEKDTRQITRTTKPPLDELLSGSASDPEQPQDTPRLVDSFLLLVRNWGSIRFENDRMAQNMRAYLRRDISEVLADYIEIDYRELGRITAEDITSWDELISEL
ncbi:hypothetical protein AA0119_g6721 [Alternaria tenuissima]|uniref:Nephrocystin 3-like N-terminal domain-containing protein n=1 Tax=Alternaria tenuissima TaxID=119927 RepID=A0ABY0G7H0_9PLEO|nr:hypothetical protein AA0119_g6721 [Alternaria tenuissima]